MKIFASQTGQPAYHIPAAGDLHFASTVAGNCGERIRTEEDRFTAYTGTPFSPTDNDDVIGSLHRDELKIEELLGGYCLLSGGPGKLCVQTDPLGQQFVYCNADESIISTCFLAVLAGLDTATLNEQALYEYIFFGSIYGGDTLVREARLLMPGERLEIRAGTATSTKPLPIEALPFAGSFEQAVKSVSEQVVSTLSAIGGSFNQIDTALSGGFDTRLILAGLRTSGAKNYRLHVYGSDGAADVTLAKRICAGEGLPLKHHTKTVAKAESAALDWEQLLEQNMLMFDGLPTDGIVDEGSDLSTRLERAEGGAVSLNGGCGEIMRNFFYLPDKALSVGHVIDAFYRRYALETVCESFSEKDFRERLGSKILAAVGLEGSLTTALSRSDIERVYPLFRGRYWTSRNTSINLRLGRAVLPFFTPELVRLTAGLPMRYKTYGKLEAAVINKLDPALARYPSDYGFDFASGPSLKYRLKSLPSVRRPFWLRRNSFQLQHRRMHPPAAFDYLPKELTKIDLLGRYFLPDRMRDAAQIKRLLSAEYLGLRFKLAIPSGV